MGPVHPTTTIDLGALGGGCAASTRWRSASTSSPAAVLPPGARSGPALWLSTISLSPRLSTWLSGGLRCVRLSADR